MTGVEDVAPALLEQIQADFQARVKENKKLQELMELIDAGKATYIQAEAAAHEIGQALSQAFGNCLSSAVLPDGKMYYNIAQRVVAPMLGANHQMIATVAEQVQTALNKRAKIGVKAQTVPVDEDRVYGIVSKVSEADQFDDVAWVLGEPVVNFSQSVVDRFIQKNVEFQGKAGLNPKIIRTATRRCCEWCQTLAGEYDYPMVPDDIYRRHENCGCTIEYDPITGRRQNVHTKLFTESEETAKMEARKVIGRKANGTTIRGLSDHTVQRMASRNVTIEGILDAIENPLDTTPVKTDDQGRPSFRLIGRKVTVAINPDNGIITTTHPTHTRTANKLLRKKGEK